MMVLIQVDKFGPLSCPDCGWEFIHRRNGRCPNRSCRVRLIVAGEYFCRDERTWFLNSEGQWRLVGAVISENRRLDGAKRQGGAGVVQVTERWKCKACGRVTITVGEPIAYYREMGRDLHCFDCDRKTRHIYQGAKRA